MNAETTTIRTVELSEVRDRLDALVLQAGGGETRVLVEEGGVPVAGLVSAEDVRRLDRLDRERAELFGALDDIRAAFADEDPEETQRQTDRILAELRAEDAALRAKRAARRAEKAVPAK